jgi:hypothetical protein
MEERALEYPLAEKPRLRKTRAQRNQVSGKQRIRKQRIRKTRAQGNQGSDKSGLREVRA